MRPEDLIVVLRQRDLHEASDLGVRLVQQFPGVVFGPWLSCTIPFAATCLVASYWYPGWALLSFWLLIVIFERVVLYSLSRAVFNAPPTTRQSLAALFPGEMSGILLQLTLLRLSPQRSATLPILQLERARFREYFRRVAFLMRGSSMPVAITLAYAMVEFLLSLASLVAIIVLAPQYEFDLSRWEWILGEGASKYVLLNGLYFGCVVLLRPFYVASGFAVYLSQRTRIDGWDIELTLKGLAARLARRMTAAAKSTAALLVAGLIWLGGSVALAQSVGPKETIRRIKESADFHTWYEQTTYFEPRLTGVELGGLGPFFKILCIALGVALLAWVAYWAWKYRTRLSPSTTRADEPSEVVNDVVLDREKTLPADPAGEAIKLAGEGRYREALSLCLRACIVVFGRRLPRPIPQGATETECARLVSGHVSPLGEDYFRRLARAWRQLAYARDSIEHSTATRLAEDLHNALQTAEQPNEVLAGRSDRL
jgi:hypothetical protein